MRGQNKTLRAAAQAGFTLIEVTFAGFVLAVTILGLTATLTTGHKLTQSSREEVTARYAMRAMAAQLSDTDYDAVANTFSGKGFAVEGLHPAADDEDGMPGEVVFESGPADAPDMHKVTLRVRWRGHTGERMIENVHYLADVHAAPGEAQSEALATVLGDYEGDEEEPVDPVAAAFEFFLPTEEPTTTTGNGNGKGKKK